MAKAPELVQIRPEDFDPDHQDTVEKLADVLNNFILQVTQLLTQTLTFSDNFNAEVRTLKMVGGQPLTFSLNTVSSPAGVVVLKYLNTTTPSEVLSSPVGIPQWSFDGRGSVTIQPIPNLTNGERYDIILLIVAE